MMTQTMEVSMPFILLLLLLLAGLTSIVLIDPYIQRDRRKNMLIIIALIFSLIFRDYLGFLLDEKGTMPFERTLVAIYGYSVRPVILVLLCYMVSTKRKIRAAWVLVGINAAIHLTAIFSGICFSIDADNQFHRGVLGYSCHIVSGIFLIYLAYLTIREFKRAGKIETWIPIFNVLLIIASVVLDSTVDYRKIPVTFLTVAVVSSNVFYYIWLHLQFVREHERDLMAEQRIQIMMSQIQPHFLYNTLSTIQALCRIDPEKAFHTTEKFGAYLRQNIDSLDQPDLIPIQKELEHTRVYAEIERIRFPNIHIEYDIQDGEFSLPALTIQPLVENAIRHGVRIREKGQVSVSIHKVPGYHEIVVRDNGKGFDVVAVQRAEGRHIGIRNVRERVEKMCGGKLNVESRIDEGTSVTIRIPFPQE